MRLKRKSVPMSEGDKKIVSSTVHLKQDRRGMHPQLSASISVWASHDNQIFYRLFYSAIQTNTEQDFLHTHKKGTAERAQDCRVRAVPGGDGCCRVVETTPVTVWSSLARNQCLCSCCSLGEWVQRITVLATGLATILDSMTHLYHCQIHLLSTRHWPYLSWSITNVQTFMYFEAGWNMLMYNLIKISLTHSWKLT
jgi:hypothetical protein